MQSLQNRWYRGNVWRWTSARAAVLALVALALVLSGCPTPAPVDDGAVQDTPTVDDFRMGMDSPNPSDASSLMDVLGDGSSTDSATMDGSAADAAVLSMDAAVSETGADVLPVGVGMTPPDPDDPDRFDTISLPDARYENMPATLTVNGVEFIDPDGLLAGRMVTVASLNPATLMPAVENALASWQFEPSGPLGGVVYARFPLAVARRPGERLLLWTLDAGDGAWATQAVGRVLADGRHVLFAMSHFSPQTVAYETAARTAFVNGTDCRLLDGGTDAGPDADVPNPVIFGEALTLGQHLPAGGELATVGAREIAYTHEMGLCVLTRMTDNNNIRNTVVFKNNDPVPYENEDLYGDPNIETPLETLGRLVRERSCGTLALRVTENFDSLREHTGRSTHFEGRGIDLTLASSTPGGALPVAGAAIYTAGYGRLARLASEAGFDWAWYENAVHVHADVRRGLEGAARTAAIRRCHEAGVRGAVRSMGASGAGMMPAGNGGNVTVTATGTSTGSQPGSLEQQWFTVDAGVTVNALPATVSYARIEGTVNLAADRILRVNYGFYLAPTGRINCPGCSLTINSRGNVQIDGVIDLSANAMSASRNGGNLTVTVPTDLVPVLRIPSIDVRGGDGDGTAGGLGGRISITGVGDLTVGYEPGGANGPLSRAQTDHFSQGGRSWTVVPAVETRGAHTGLLSGGGVGGPGVLGGAMTAGLTGGNGGNITISLSADSANLLGRTYFFDTFVSTGGVPGARALSPVELFHFDDVARRVDPIDIGVGSTGGRGAQSFGNVRGGDGGPGGNGGNFTLTAPAATLCPSLAGAADFAVVGANGMASNMVGTGRRATVGACSLSYTVAGGSGGVQGGSGTGFPGNAGAAGMPGTAMVP